MATFNGAEGDETAVGGAEPDQFDGAGGNDTLIGGGGADRLTGGDGVDMLLGGTSSASRSASPDGAAPAGRRRRRRLPAERADLCAGGAGRRGR